MSIKDVKDSRKTEYPERLRASLSKDVHAILSVCLHQFEEGREIEEVCFDVDGIVAGRMPKARTLHERRISPAPIHTREVRLSHASPVPQIGNFIPRPLSQRSLFSFA